MDLWVAFLDGSFAAARCGESGRGYAYRDTKAVTGTWVTVIMSSTSKRRSPVEERFALYYPYIHIRDDDWLKNTLLTFGQVRRMVPRDFELTDHELVYQLRKLKDSNGNAFVTEEALDTAAVFDAQSRLLDRLRADPIAPAQFSRDEAGRLGSPDAFQVHREKASTELLKYLTANKMAWPALTREKDPKNWFSVHPHLGEAIMSLTAIAIARDKGLSIVTSDARVHQALVTNDEKAVFDALASRTSRQMIPMKSGADEVLQAVIVHSFDLSTLSAEDVAALVREQTSLRALRESIEKEAAKIPPIANMQEREARLKAAAAQVKEQWRSSKRNRVWEAMKTLVDISQLALPATATSLLEGASLTSVTLGAGLAVVFLTYSGFRAVRSFREAGNTPFRYLTLIEERIRLSAIA
jgi:hypothetical protein